MHRVNSKLLTTFHSIAYRSLTKSNSLNNGCLGAAISTQVHALSSDVDSDSDTDILAKPSGAPPIQPYESASYCLNLFHGALVPEQCFPYPDVLTADQHETLEMLVGPLNKFLQEKNDAAKNDEMEKIPDEVMNGLKEMGAFGLQVPAKYDGVGLNNTQYGRILEVVGGHDLSISASLAAHQSIGLKGIICNGTPEQQKKYLPELATGKKVAAFCLTEPGSGSDAASVKTRAVLSDDKTHFILNGSKIWITNGGIAEVMTVFAQTAVKDPKTGITSDKITAFIVERSFGGVSNGKPAKKMGLKASNTCEVFFDNVKVPVENVIARVGSGFKVAVNTLNMGRFCMGALLSGTMRSAIMKASEFASSRRQFGRRIETFGAIQEKIARMAMYQYVTESLAYMVAGNMDRGCTDYRLEAAITKLYATEAAWWVVDEAIQVMGGMGYMKETGLERMLRDLRIFRIFEGTNDILRLFIALTGTQFYGVHLRQLKKACKDLTSPENVGIVISKGTKRAIKSAGLETSAKKYIISPHIHPSLSRQAEYVSQAAEAIGHAVDAAFVRYRKGIAEEQFVCKRLADAVIQTYVMSAAISRASLSIKKNLPSAEHEVLMAKAFSNEAIDIIRSNLAGMKNTKSLKNYKIMKQISQNICKYGGVAHQNPLGI